MGAPVGPPDGLRDYPEEREAASHRGEHADLRLRVVAGANGGAQQHARASGLLLEPAESARRGGGHQPLASKQWSLTLDICELLTAVLQRTSLLIRRGTHLRFAHRTLRDVFVTEIGSFPCWRRSK